MAYSTKKLWFRIIRFRFKRIIYYVCNLNHVSIRRDRYGACYDSFFTAFTLLLLINILFCIESKAQNTMRIYYKDGSVYEVPIECIDSITFTQNTEDPYEASLIGEWFWGNKEFGYYELLTFNEDKTYTGFDYYFTYGFDTITYGWFMQIGNLLTLQSNGFGYNRRYNWFVMGLTNNALDVMTKMGRFIYYRVQSEVYSLKVGEESYECIDGDYYVFTDGIKISDNGGKLKGIVVGTSYILKYDAKSELIKAYKVIVEE